MELEPLVLRGYFAHVSGVVKCIKDQSFVRVTSDPEYLHEQKNYATHVNGWEPAVFMGCMSQNFRLFHVSNLSARNFRIFLLM